MASLPDLSFTPDGSAAHSLVHGLFHILAGGVYVAIEYMLALLAHHMTLGQNAQSLEHLSHPLGHLGLAGTRIAGDDYMDIGLLHLAAAHGLDARQLYPVGE